MTTSQSTLLHPFRTHTGGWNWPRLAIIFLALLSLGVSLYMVKHFFDVHFLSDLNSAGSICSINGFFNCDKATHSNIATIMNVPIAFFGALLSCCFLIGGLFASPSLEKTNGFLSTLNIVGCLGLFLYSLIALGGLCPMCTLYYIFSLGIFLIYAKSGLRRLVPSVKILSAYAFIFCVLGIYVSSKVAAKTIEMSQTQKKIIDQFFSLPAVGDPVMEETFFLHKANDHFKDAPLRLSIFSDLQCPSCKAFGKEIETLIQRYPKTLNIQYLFFPLDHQCNSMLKQPMHMQACQLSYLAACQKNDFKKAHDEIFDAQEKMDQQWVNEQVQKKNLSSCVQNHATQEAIQKTIQLGQTYAVESTPTIVVNGIKLASVPAPLLIMIFDELLRRQGLPTHD